MHPFKNTTETFNPLILTSVALDFKIQLLFKTILHYEALNLLAVTLSFAAQ